MGASLGGERNVRLLSPEIASPTYLQRDRVEREPQTTEDLCAVCLSELSRAKCFQLPGCGHRFHALCIASAFQIQQLCPLCRVVVDDSTCMDVARSLFAGAGPHGASFAAELLSELGSRLRTVETELSVEETVAAIQRCAKQGDDSKIPMIATLLQAAPSGSEGPAAVQELEVRLAAVQALRTLVPAFPAQWPGWQAVRGLLREVACEAGAAEELRLSAVQALKEVSRRDARDEALSAARLLLEDPRTSRELRLAAGGILQAIAAPDDLDTARLALVALHERYSCSLRAHAAQALRTIAGPRGACNGAILAGLSDLVRTSDFPEVRCEAVQLLGQLDDFGGDAGMTACTAALDDAEEEVARAAVQAISALFPPEPSQASEEALRGLLAKLTPDACFGQLRCDILLVLPRLAVCDRSRTASAAAACLLDPDLSVSNAAVQAIRKLCQRGDATLEEELLRYATHEDLEIRRTVVELLGLVASRGGPAVSRADI
ncbi:XRN4 [Symbiodinium sp. CCMP2592]|nr:XRN4 [Symbiodinium sp. CCMP2592]